MARIFHIATAADWRAALDSGRYTTSTVGRTLAEEGFIHASRREQVPGVFERHYRDVREPLVLLTIDTERLEAAVREDAVGEETFPHVYGPIRPQDVVEAVPLGRHGRPETFASLFFKEMARRMGIATAVMLAIVVVVVAVQELIG